MSICTTFIRGAAVGLAVFVAPGCQSRSGGATPPASPPASPAAAIARPAPTLPELKNATYRDVEEAGAAFTLSGGSWEGRPAAPGAASRPSVTFVRDFRLAGDLDGDGVEEAVVLLAASAGGSGERSYLAVVGRPGGTLTNIATARIGDRVQVRGARIEGRRIVLDVVQAGAQDAACCPGEFVTRTWELDAGTLREAAPVIKGRLSIEALAGSEWVLRSWAWDEAAPAAPEVTLTFDGNRLAGNAGCNAYFAQAKGGEQPGALNIGPVGATRKMCPEPAMAAEARFLRQLGGVSQLRFVAGQLALQYAKPDHTFGVMLFDRRAAK
jgi:heat shock protein HslJ